MNKPKISIIWDFDKTLTSHDSTTELIRFFIRDKTDQFWNEVKEISGVDARAPVNSISTSEAPVWMYLLSEMAVSIEGDKRALDEKQIKKMIATNKIKVELYPNVLEFLKKIKSLFSEKLFEKNNIEIHHFIITAGLQDLVSSVFKLYKSEYLISKIFGCRYKTIKIPNTERVEKNIPIYCMDKTAKTRALFEICKGCFLPTAQYKVDDLVPKEKEWCPFENMIYIGDGDTDIPAFSLVKSRKGMTIGVYNPIEAKDNVMNKAKSMRKGKRIDLFTPADFEETGELFRFIKIRCEQIAKRYEAHKFVNGV